MTITTFTSNVFILKHSNQMKLCYIKENKLNSNLIFPLLHFSCFVVISSNFDYLTYEKVCFELDLFEQQNYYRTIIIRKYVSSEKKNNNLSIKESKKWKWKKSISSNGYNDRTKETLNCVSCFLTFLILFLFEQQ